ncbi:MAG TPA: hypothetical protein VD905_19580 [Flavobacteriales bacterium]|nr:hypothetical protein [Flavobacteriales bacterium]
MVINRTFTGEKEEISITDLESGIYIVNFWIIALLANASCGKIDEDHTYLYGKCKMQINPKK